MQKPLSMKNHSNHNKSKCRGFSLIEVLVTFIVLSVGLLGLAALHANGLKNNQSAYWRSQATFLAYGILDSMRANRVAGLDEDYDLALADSPATGTSIAAVDLTNWINTLSSTLPAGDGSIDCVAASSICTVVVQWNDSMGEGGSDTQQFTVMTQL
ncbi:MAG: type IV pilus modification protein PilV [Pseudomonadota bacterium]